ncbi:methionyl-tRNA formyltransferase [Dissulfurispira thermophila]|uniref:Methionyl-tRNA formyltransferase n=2 Tax=root TaxID=1 RepID=A0A7G1H473_9BACT|nr:methionyl-tRNA formyltransferase [Dissulfurispira thermophila]BCB96971.1 methionyl-tRNA formyltransferase [Dissulfurispira thermophila]
MALIFFGTPQFAVPSLKALIEAKEDIALVVTQPDKVKGRGHVLSAPPVKELALSHGIKVIQPVNIREESFYKELKVLNPEFIIVVAYGKILPNEILNMPKIGCINVHASLLPKYRGAAPIQWALINGEKVTGITTMLMDKGLDTGDILLRAELEIQDDDNAETLFDKLSRLGADVLLDTIRGMREGKIKPMPQMGEVSYAPPLKKQDGKIDWTRSADELFNFVRGMYPWPSAFCYLGNERIKIIKVRRQSPNIKGLELTYDTQRSVPGRIVKASNGQIFVETGKGFLIIDELQPEGKKIMAARAFLSGRMLKEGYDRFI